MAKLFLQTVNILTRRRALSSQYDLNILFYFLLLLKETYRTGSATLLRVAISSVETRKSRDFLWWKLRGISEEVTRVQRVAWKTSVEILATSV